MCDYSLHEFASRPAQVGDKLIVHRFGFTRGFCEVGKPNVAVCLLPGTEVAFDRQPKYDSPSLRLLQRFGIGKIAKNEARFRQINMARQHVHHDALEFADGQVVLLTSLQAGQRATVLQLPISDYDAQTRGHVQQEPEPATSSLV